MPNIDHVLSTVYSLKRSQCVDLKIHNILYWLNENSQSLCWKIEIPTKGLRELYMYRTCVCVDLVLCVFLCYVW